MIKKQYTLYLENRPGAMAKVTKTLATAGVNLEGVSVSESTDVGLVQLIPSNAAKTKKALDKVKVPFTVQDVATIELPNKAGALSRMAAKLARAGVNINYLYGTVCKCSSDSHCMLVVSASNLKKVEAALK